MIRKVDPDLAEENTSDFGIDFALSVGSTARNDVWCPDILGISDGVADRIEERQQSVLTRDDTVVAIPIVSLGGGELSKENREQLFERLCIAFMGGLKMPSVWLVALAGVLSLFDLFHCRLRLVFLVFLFVCLCFLYLH